MEVIVATALQSDHVEPTSCLIVYIWWLSPRSSVVRTLRRLAPLHDGGGARVSDSTYDIVRILVLLLPSLIRRLLSLMLVYLRHRLKVLARPGGRGFGQRTLANHRHEQKTRVKG